MNLTKRELFWQFSKFEQIDHLPYWADWLGPWDRWRKEGLPLPSTTDDDTLKRWVLEYFGFEGMFSVFWGQPRLPIDIGVYPPFEEETLEETQDYRIFRATNGVIEKQFKRRSGSLNSTTFIEYPIKNRRDWINFRDQHLDPDAAGRYPDDDHWKILKQSLQNRDFVISVDGGSFYGFLRDWIGFQNLSYMTYDQPGLVHEMMDYLGDYYVQILTRAVSEIDVDFAMFWEDMCYKTGPLISPAMFRKFMLPNYQKVTRFLADHGVRLSWVDSDGNIEALLPLWLEGGVRGFYPMEVAAGMDAIKLRRQYGQEILMWGNVDKRALIAGKEAIDIELARLQPAIAAGGFIPLVDHSVPDDVPLENYLYSLERRKALTGN
jgi:hypothetical protein